jgi:GNAT superfamily N-acetyltransferase
MLMRIVNLRDRPDLCDELSRWHFAEWAHLYSAWTLSTCRAELESHCLSEGIPTTFAALNDSGEFIGSVSLLLDDLPGYEHLSPWVASLFVLPERRGADTGSALLSAAVDYARLLGVERVYLFTPSHRDYYAARGWSLLGPVDANGTTAHLMMRSSEGVRAGFGFMLGDCHG